MAKKFVELYVGRFGFGATWALMGPHIARRPVESVNAVGLTLLEEDDVHADWVKMIVAV